VAYSIMSDMIRNGTQSPVMGLNLARVGFGEGCAPNRSEEDHAESIAYATRTPKNGSAKDNPTRSCVWHRYEHIGTKIASGTEI
jgi:hypothetical protein